MKLNNDIKAASFREGQKLYIDPAKLLPIERFLSQAPGARGRGRGRGGDRGASRGSFLQSALLLKNGLLFFVPHGVIY